MECAMTHSHNFAKRQHGTRLKSTKTVSLFGKIYNLNAGLWKKLPTKAEVGLFSKFLLETVLTKNICENSFPFVSSIFTKQTFSPYSVFV